MANVQILTRTAEGGVESAPPFCHFSMDGVNFWYVLPSGFRMIYSLQIFLPFLGVSGSHFVLKMLFGEKRQKSWHAKTPKSPKKRSKMDQNVTIYKFF